MDIFHHGFSHAFKGPGAVVIVWTGINNNKRSLNFVLESNLLGFLTVPTDKDVND
jgi:hypothetical protein